MVKDQINKLLDTLVDPTEQQPEQEQTIIDSVALFIQDHLVDCEVDRVPVGEFHRAYLTFCSYRNYAAVPLSKIANALRDKGYLVTPGRYSRHYIRSCSLLP